MYQLDEEDVETVHLYVVSEEECVDVPINIGRIINIVLCCMCLPLLLLLPSGMDIAPWFVTVPLATLPGQQFTATMPVEQTGTRVIEATRASGWLTVYNGSFLVQQLPRGFVVEATGGVTLVTDASVTIPSGEPPNYGQARVSAHAIAAGRAGNVRALAVSAVLSSSLYLKNLTALTGGADSYTQAYATDDDQRLALTTARYQLKQRVVQDHALLVRPCGESPAYESRALTLTWNCQFASYEVPSGLHVLGVQLVGDSVRLEVRR